MEIIKQSFLSLNHKKVFVLLCLHEDEPFLEGSDFTTWRNFMRYNHFIFSLLQEGPSYTTQSNTNS
jgi:hypothetical protein